MRKKRRVKRNLRRRHLYRASSARKHTKKARTKRLQRMWKDVANSELKRGRSRSRAIRAADSVVKRRVTVLKRNPQPRKAYLLEAITRRGKHGINFFYWNGKSFSAERSKGLEFISQAAAYKKGQELRNQLPDSVLVLRTAPA